MTKVTLALIQVLLKKMSLQKYQLHLPLLKKENESTLIRFNYSHKLTAF